MQRIIIDVENLRLPPSFLEKFGQKVIVQEVKEGILISPAKETPNLRGACKGKFSTAQYFELKKMDRELEE